MEWDLPNLAVALPPSEVTGSPPVETLGGSV